MKLKDKNYQLSNRVLRMIHITVTTHQTRPSILQLSKHRGHPRVNVQLQALILVKSQNHRT